MQVKAADDKSSLLASLESRRSKAGLSSVQLQRIEQEIRNVKSGIRGEREAAYEIESAAHDFPNLMTIHDLRIDDGGWTAQIDHLIINRYLGIWVCESKSFSEGVEINDHGDWSAIYGGIPQGIPSPVQQNKRHIRILKSIFEKGVVRLPKRLGLITIQPTIVGVVLVSNRAHIVRPNNPSPQIREDVSSVMKAEQLVDAINRMVDRTIETEFISTIAKVVSRTTIERLARDLVALHSPAPGDYAAKFDVGSDTRSQEIQPATPWAERTREDESTPAVSRCANCGRGVSDGIVAYCRDHASTFSNRVFCYPCQQLVRGGQVS